MPRKKYNDEELKQKAIDLRTKGYSYREIAKTLGCSVYKIHDLIAPYENLNSRLRQAAELARKVDAMSDKVSRLESVIGLMKPLDELNKDVLMVKQELGRISKEIASIKNDMRLINESGNLRFLEGYRCVNMDIAGYCRFWMLHYKMEGWDMIQEKDKDGKVYYRLNVQKHRLFCTVCPAYKPISKKEEGKK
jgi:predicted transcriptional regulator